MIDERTWPELLQKLGSQRAVARYLGIEEYQLRRMLKKLGLPSAGEQGHTKGHRPKPPPVPIEQAVSAPAAEKPPVVLPMTNPRTPKRLTALPPSTEQESLEAIYVALWKALRNSLLRLTEETADAEAKQRDVQSRVMSVAVLIDKFLLISDRLSAERGAEAADENRQAIQALREQIKARFERARAKAN